MLTVIVLPEERWSKCCECHDYAVIGRLSSNFIVYIQAVHKSQSRLLN